jgi:hypothetical protein
MKFHTLELTEEELAALWALLTLLDMGAWGLDDAERSVHSKVQKLMETAPELAR